MFHSTRFLLLSLADLQNAQLLMLAGFVLLGWVLARRQLKMRKRVHRDARAANKQLNAIRQRGEPSLPLADAPPETQRWQVAMFDLQRELKAELDTRIVIVQSLMRQLDARIERLSQLDPSQAVHTDPATPGCREQVEAMVRAGHTCSEIATHTGISLGDVELIANTIQL